MELATVRRLPFPMNTDQPYIPLAECKPGGIYTLHSRNLDLGVFDGRIGFIGIRCKFDRYYLFTEDHWDVGPPYGTAHPLKLVGQLPPDISLNERCLHPGGDLWARRDGVEVAATRRDLVAGEAPHFKRQGFVDYWADTGERLPEHCWPYLKQNQPLFDLLTAMGKDPTNFPPQ